MWMGGEGTIRPLPMGCRRRSLQEFSGDDAADHETFNQPGVCGLSWSVGWPGTEPVEKLDPTALITAMPMDGSGSKAFRIQSA